jgi:sec-independent protein translocase protein TatA
MGTGILNPVHVVFLLVVVLMLFGAKRLPELGKSLGTGLRQFKDSVEGGDGAAAGKPPEGLPPAAGD